jgi:hypothetical protein
MTNQPEYKLTPHVFAGMRIAEEEKLARAAQANEKQWFGHGADLDIDSRELELHDNGVTVCAQPSRILAQCAAYRAIVKASSEYGIPGNVKWEPASGSLYFGDRITEVFVYERGSLPLRYTMEEFTKRYAVQEVSPELLALCSIWSTHPDYNSEWAVA